MSRFVEKLLELLHWKQEPLEPIIQLRRVIVEPHKDNDLALCLLYNRIRDVEYEEWVPQEQLKALKKTVRNSSSDR